MIEQRLFIEQLINFGYSFGPHHSWIYIFSGFFGIYFHDVLELNVL